MPCIFSFQTFGLAWDDTYSFFKDQKLELHVHIYMAWHVTATLIMG